MIGVSRTILMRILTDMQVGLDQPEVEQLYRELLTYFGLIGASNQCEALDAAWTDPYNRNEIEEFIKAWLRRKQGKKKEARVSVV